MKTTVFFFILFFPLLLFSEDKKGAEVEIITSEAEQIRGELIAVKDTSLLILERETGRDRTFLFSDVSQIIIVKRSRIIFGTTLGALAGGVTGMLLGALVSFTDNEEEDKSWDYGKIGGTIGLGAGAAGGALFGFLEGKDKRVLFSELPPQEKEAFLEELRNMARVTGRQ